MSEKASNYIIIGVGVFAAVLLAYLLLCCWPLQNNGGGNADPGVFIEQAQHESAKIEEGIASAEKRGERIEEGARNLENLSGESAELIARCQQILRNVKGRGKTEE